MQETVGKPSNPRRNLGATLASRPDWEGLLLEYYKRGHLPDLQLSALSSALRTFVAYAPDDEPASVVESVLFKITIGSSLDTRDVTDTLAFVRDVNREFDASVFPATEERLAVAEKYASRPELAELSAILQKTRERQLDKSHWLEKVLQYVVANPGLYLGQLHRKLVRDVQIPVSYAAVRAYIDTLVAEDKVLTIGGPQGVVRFCFPHPRTIRNADDYFGKLFPVDGIVEKDVSDRFQDLSLHTFKSVFLVNTKNPAVLLAAPASVVKPGNLELKACGELVSMKDARSIGLQPKSDQKGLPKRIVNATKIAVVRKDGTEEEVWFDKRYWALKLSQQDR